MAPVPIPRARLGPTHSSGSSLAPQRLLAVATCVTVQSRKRAVRTATCSLGPLNTTLTSFCPLQKIEPETRVTFRVQKVTMFWLKTCHESEDEFVLANMTQLGGWSDVLNSSPRVRPLFSAQV